MIIATMTVKAYIQEGWDARMAIREFMLDDDRVSYCDVDVVSEEETERTFPEEEEEHDVPAGPGDDDYSIGIGDDDE